MNIIEKLEELLTEYDDSVHDMPLALRAIIEEYKNDQEPVAYQFLDNGEWHDFIDDRHKENTIAAGYEVRPLFTHPPLSDETVKDAAMLQWLLESGSNWIYVDVMVNEMMESNKEALYSQTTRFVIDEAMKADNA